MDVFFTRLSGYSEVVRTLVDTPLTVWDFVPSGALFAAVVAVVWSLARRHGRLNVLAMSALVTCTYGGVLLPVSLVVHMWVPLRMQLTFVFLVFAILVCAVILSVDYLVWWLRRLISGDGGPPPAAESSFFGESSPSPAYRLWRWLWRRGEGGGRHRRAEGNLG
ncbi:hypothetical protein C1Y63_01425 [Corynebacterium sp. 13CS0277]|uniref:hypothetical protein n=1 Tax=Corynebacterium sp. 13CS0277 TaxID=2071994 RepID=UPI000D039262|nr:hypothetical protein [Corynebacterium sp. 13CS0277]PRQ12250.1 hypothetical protein C1Y63_01425 [Corynebacterium sp. 13CS0277]